MKNISGEALIICVFIISLSLVGISSSFAPDTISQRIEACMVQDGMQYITMSGCVPIEEKD